jgi:hypothetical protein
MGQVNWKEALVVGWG